MSNRIRGDVAGRRIGRVDSIVLLLTCAMQAGVCGAAAPHSVPAEFQGTWVPSMAACESPLRVLVAAERLTLANGKDSQALGGIEMAGPGFFAPGYRGIMAVLITDFSGHQPATVTFNLNEKKGAAQLEFAPVSTGPSNPQLKAYNAHLSKLNLAKRFPLDKVLLKKCAG